MEYITLNDGNKIPAVGFGVFMIPADGSTYMAVTEALKAGYRHIDTAAAYMNEAEVGKAVRDSGIPREEICFAGDAQTDKARAEMYEKLRAGEKRFILASKRLAQL